MITKSAISKGNCLFSVPNSSVQIYVAGKYTIQERKWIFQLQSILQSANCNSQIQMFPNIPNNLLTNAMAASDTRQKQFVIYFIDVQKIGQAVPELQKIQKTGLPIFCYIIGLNPKIQIQSKILSQLFIAPVFLTVIQNRYFFLKSVEPIFKLLELSVPSQRKRKTGLKYPQYKDILNFPLFSCSISILMLLTSLIIILSLGKICNHFIFYPLSVHLIEFFQNAISKFCPSLLVQKFLIGPYGILILPFRWGLASFAIYLFLVPLSETIWELSGSMNFVRKSLMVMYQKFFSHSHQNSSYWGLKKIFSIYRHVFPLPQAILFRFLEGQSWGIFLLCTPLFFILEANTIETITAQNPKDKHFILLHIWDRTWNRFSALLSHLEVPLFWSVVITSLFCTFPILESIQAIFTRTPFFNFSIELLPAVITGWFCPELAVSALLENSVSWSNLILFFGLVLIPPCWIRAVIPLYHNFGLKKAFLISWITLIVFCFFIVLLLLI